jgi:hypothetical protein
LVLILAYDRALRKRQLSSYEKISFSGLPVPVQNFLLSVNDSTVDRNAFRCFSRDESCGCKLNSKNRFPFPEGVLILDVCNSEYRIDFSLTAFRLFILDGNDLYFPILETMAYSSSTRISDVIDLKSAIYGRITLEDL